MGTPYRECPNCGAHLDAGELCDCRRSERETRRPEQEPRKPMRLMAICREIDKDTGRIAVYPLKTEIDDRILGALKIQATMNPELRYFILVALGKVRNRDCGNSETPERHTGRRRQHRRNCGVVKRGALCG